jgi:hypothetical protein
MKAGTEKGPIQQRRPHRVTGKGLGEFLPTSVQKSYFMLSNAEKYRSGRSEPILVGGEKLLKPALRLMTDYRLAIEEVKDSEVITSYTRWLECVQLKEGPEQEVYVAFGPRFERIWLESKKRLPEYMEGGKDSGLCRIRHKPDHVGLWIMSDSCALSLSRPTSAGVWTLSNPT